MLKKTMLLLTVICMGLVLFTTSAIASDKAGDKMITADHYYRTNGGNS